MNAAETIAAAIEKYEALIKREPDEWEAAIRKVELDWLRRELMLTTEVESYVPFAYTVGLARAIVAEVQS